MMQSPPITQEITVEEMERYKQATAEMCGNLLECGFDSLLFHFGHSIPVAQFLSPADQPPHRRVWRLHREPLPLSGGDPRRLPRRH